MNLPLNLPFLGASVTSLSPDTFKRTSLPLNYCCRIGLQLGAASSFKNVSLERPGKNAISGYRIHVHAYDCMEQLHVPNTQPFGSCTSQQHAQYACMIAHMTH